MHYLYDHSGSLPSFMTMTDSKCHDIRVAREDEKLDFTLLPDSILSIDRAYLDFHWFYSLNQRGVYFVTRLKKNAVFEIVGQQKEFTHKTIVRDDKVLLSNPQSRENYPDSLRIVGVYLEEEDQYVEFLTNNFELSAKTIADIYKARWDIVPKFRDKWD